MTPQLDKTDSTSGARLIYADSVRNPDLLYLSGLSSEDRFLWWSLADRKFILVGELELARARKLVPNGTEVMSFKQARKAWAMNRQEPEIADYILALAEHSGTWYWQVPADFPLRLACNLQEKGVILKPVTPFCPERTCKKPEEIKQIRIGVRLAEHGFYHALEILEEAIINSQGILEWHGEVLTAERLRGEINMEIIRCGGLAQRTIVAPGQQAADPHETGHGPISARQPLVLDIFPQVEASGYYGDFTRTVVKGRAPEIVRQAFAAVREARETGLQTIRPGIEARLPHQKANEVLRRHGFVNGEEEGSPCGFFHGLGHGLGLAVHESPRLSPYSTDLLQQNQVVTVEPGLYYPSWGGVRLEDVAVVSAQGCDNLTAAPTFLEID